MEIAHSVNGVPIRLTYERWYHITENHDDLASYFYDGTCPIHSWRLKKAMATPA